MHERVLRDGTFGQPNYRVAETGHGGSGDLTSLPKFAVDLGDKCYNPNMPGEGPNADFARDILLHEYERMCTEIRALEGNNEKAIAFGLSIITAALTVGIAQHVHQIFFVVPIAIVGVFFYPKPRFVDSHRVAANIH